MRTKTSWKVISSSIVLALLASSCSHSEQRFTEDLSSLSQQNRQGLVELPFAAPENGVILQVFNWPFDLITSRLPEIASFGYTHLHVSPPNLTIDRAEWWGRYQPVDYRVIDGPLGDEESFRRMNAVADRLGVEIIADVVLNHMANPDFARYNARYTDNPEILYYPAPDVREKYGVDILFTPSDFNNTGCIDDYNNRMQVIFNRLCLGFPDKGLPDLNTDSPSVIQAQREFLRKLVDLGVDGFRIDALKHLPEDYLNEVLLDIDREETLVFGEIITDERNIQKNIGPYLNGSDMSFFDFPLLFMMRRAFGPDGSLRTLVDPEAFGLTVTGPRSVLFVTNHDIPNNGDIFKFLQFHDLPEEHLAYAYILGRSRGISYVYTDLGSADGLESDRYLDFYRDPVLVKMIQFRQRVEGEGMAFLWESDQVLVWSRGNSAFVGVNKSSRENFNLARVSMVGLEDGIYEDSLSGNRVQVRSGVLSSVTEQKSHAELKARKPVLFEKVSELKSL